MPKMGSFLLLFFFIFPVFVQSQNTSFFFEGFKEADKHLTLQLGASIMSDPEGVLRLTNKSNNVIGHAFYTKPIQMIDKASSPNPSSFSTSFVFEIVPPSSGSGGYGLAFLLAPSTQLPGAEPGWSFQLNGVVARPLNVSNLPKPPQREKISASYDGNTVALISSLCVVTVLLMGLLGYFLFHRREEDSEVLEDWEIDCPHRFRYKDLYVATNGFKESEVIGTGGFGSVYKGVLSTNGSEVAVKKITRNSHQGMREFAAEIESLGRLRHKNLVHLLGWCKKKNDLLLVYEYIPNGSLDSLLFKPKNGFVLNWEQRFNIIKGIASGLLYLHEEWEQVVIHRDVKSSNVLIDAELNARLGDFGLARLYDHGGMSHTTSVVGTIGYIAPELTRTGKASASSDVFAFGILLLELATGRRPIGSSDFLLVDWVRDCQQLAQILDTADPSLNSSYSVEEMELALTLGLICSHERIEVRPTTRQVMRYLNGDDILSFVDDWGSADYSQQGSEFGSRTFQISDDCGLLDHSTKVKHSTADDPKTIALISALCIVTVLLLCIVGCFLSFRRRRNSETLEDWEINSPHRLRYKDLYAAIKGFKESEATGIGGFSAVYKGVLPNDGREIAVKKRCVA
ncbi:hypothetical protein LWI29_002630 [Acer saccharum]|uniref:non-specific serine/threonine protein kinase n=1 Tax=Acer saccharum TaxID=4024 RepID=A0AA39S2G6_ACESA|nr:hypothetical protein LWI29_002630 [Acer saccharum]